MIYPWVWHLMLWSGVGFLLLIAPSDLRQKRGHDWGPVLSEPDTKSCDTRRDILREMLTWPEHVL